MKTNQFIPLLGLLLLGGCSTIERGVIVAKGHRENAAVSPPVDCYWVDVRGKNRAGVEKKERVQLFKPDWDRYKKGDHIAPHDHDLLGVARALGASVKKFAKAGGTPTPAPGTPKPKAKPLKPAKPEKPDRPVVTKKTPSLPAPAPKLATPRPRPKAESEAVRMAKLRSVEARAFEDPVVRDLKKKIYGAKTDEEQTAAYREYRRGLYQKMRELEPSLKDRIDAAENAASTR